MFAGLSSLPSRLAHRRGSEEAPTPTPPQLFKTAEDAAPPDRVGVQLGFGSPPPPPRAFEVAKDAIPPDRGDDHLDFRSEDIENTNGDRGDHGCGLSGAQATAQKAVVKSDKEDGVKRNKKNVPVCGSCGPTHSHFRFRREVADDHRESAQQYRNKQARRG